MIENLKNLKCIKINNITILNKDEQHNLSKDKDKKEATSIQYYISTYKEI